MTAIARHWNIFRSALAEEKARKKSRKASEETAFLPAALEIIETPVSPTGRITAWLLLGALVFAGCWLTFGTLDVVASAPGKLIPTNNVKVIQPAQSGVVRAIKVHDGQHVAKGQTLIELDPTVSTADAEKARKALEVAELDSARARAILSALNGNGLNFVAPEGAAPDVTAHQRALAEAELADIEASSLVHGSDRAAAVAARQEARIQAAKLSETLPLLDEQIEANEKLLAKGYVSKLKVIEMRRQRLAAVRDRDAALATANRADAQMASAGGAMRQAVAEARVKVLGDLTQAEAEAKLRRQELAKAEQMSRLQRVVSPVDGTVSQLAVHTIGGTVETAKPIMVVVPSGGTLVAEVKILNRDIGFVHPGQPVAVKLDAFPFTRFGTLEGTVESIGSDAVEDDKLGLVYPARVTLRKAESDQIRADVGMQATADIRTGRRSILSYLLSPIDEASQEAGRER